MQQKNNWNIRIFPLASLMYFYIKNRIMGSLSPWAIKLWNHRLEHLSVPPPFFWTNRIFWASRIFLTLPVGSSISFWYLSELFICLFFSDLSWSKLFIKFSKIKSSQHSSPKFCMITFISQLAEEMPMCFLQIPVLSMAPYPWVVTSLQTSSSGPNSKDSHRELFAIKMEREPLKETGPDPTSESLLQLTASLEP